MNRLNLKELGKLLMKETERVSDGYHTFSELYEFRKMYNALLFNEWYKQGKYQVHKSWRHYNEDKCFNSDDWFIVSAMLPTGQISNHYKRLDWDLFQVEETPKALFEFDGHTSEDVLERMIKLISYEKNKNKS